MHGLIIVRDGFVILPFLGVDVTPVIVCLPITGVDTYSLGVVRYSFVYILNSRRKF
jgi:hypothetical protein